MSSMLLDLNAGDCEANNIAELLREQLHVPQGKLCGAAQTSAAVGLDVQLRGCITDTALPAWQAIPSM